MYFFRSLAFSQLLLLFVVDRSQSKLVESGRGCKVVTTPASSSNKAALNNITVPATTCALIVENLRYTHSVRAPVFERFYVSDGGRTKTLKLIKKYIY